ncbi:glutathione S-transferase 1-1-like [Tribolium madens]|uniref:glutathione S-transferase 1-1-like n=1 Tax=Tribolium madens TaxID=41895 RepID=UPI001CF75D4E|nr:glutathione S-transferase 1-1-like [Tribolium madens]
MAPTLYMYQASSSVRAVLITAKALDLKFNEKEIDFLHLDHLKPEYFQLNPQHTIPTLVDDDFILWDSHAIMIYIVSKYAKNNLLYPEDLKKRAVIHQRLYFEAGVLSVQMRNFAFAVLYENKTSIDQKDKEAIHESYGILETFLEGKVWIAGDSVTIADYSLIATVSTLNAFVSIDTKKYRKLSKWVLQCENLPEYEVNRKGLMEVHNILKNKLSIV